MNTNVSLSVCHVINAVFPLFLLQTLKPLMEKRRRARINESLNKLKELIVPLVGKDVSSRKLEIHDIYLKQFTFLVRMAP